LETYAKKCKTGLTKQLMSVFIYTVKTQIRQMCKKDSKKRRKLMAARNCVDAAKHEFEKCIINLIDTLQGIKLADDKKKIPLSCW
jgi:hypothetical protein